MLDWDRASPVLRFTNLSGVRVRTARKIIPAAWASVLIESRSTPLLVGGERGASRVLYAAFRPTQSDLPLRVAFPVFVSNAVSYLSAGVANTDARVVRPGDALAFPPGASVSGDTSRVGRYTVTQNGVKTTLAVSLSSAGESQTAPDPSPQIVVTNAADAGDGAKPRRAPREWGMWLAAPLLLLLVGEWWAWSRRKR